MRRYVRHAKRSRAAMIAANRKRRPADSTPVAEPTVPAPEPPPEPSHTSEAEGGDPTAYVGYHVKQSGTWYKLIGPDGEQVGKASRDEAEVRAQIPGED